MRAIGVLLCLVITSALCAFSSRFSAFKARSIQSSGTLTPTPTPALLTPSYICPPHGTFREIPPVPSLPEAFEDIFEARINHVGILFHTDLEVTNQLNAFQNLGIGPFVLAGSSSDMGTYCGRNVTLNTTVYLGGVPELTDPSSVTCADAKRAFFEIAQLTSNDVNFYNYFYNEVGPGTFYTGLGLKVGVTRDQMLDLLARKGQKVFYSYTFPTYNNLGQLVTAYADFVRIGYTYHEIASADGVYLP